MEKILALLVFVSLSALAVEAKKDPCEPFIKKFCAQRKTQFAISKCLVANDKKLNSVCRNQMIESLNKNNACSVAVLNLCPTATELDVSANITCLAKNYTRLPTDCAQVLDVRDKKMKTAVGEFTQACGSENAKHCPGITDSSLLGDCMHNAYVAKKVEGECKVVMDKYAAMRKKKPRR